MKNLLFLLCLICALAGCKSDNRTISSGTYKMEMEQAQKEQVVLIPSLSIDAEKKEFAFVYDVLSSYFPVGTYKIENNVLTATTNDDLYHYVFEIVDENTLSFSAEDSSEMTVFDEYSSIIPQDGTLFQKE